MITPPTPTTGEIFLLNVPFDSNYHHVIDFKSAEARYKYFLNNYVVTYERPGEEPIKFYWEDCSYSRRDGVLYVPVHIDKLYKVNYLMFRNAYYSTKLFYCFVVNQKYVNDGCTALTITLDVYSTWQNYITWRPSFVEREHIPVEDDIPGKNLAAEGVETGELVPYEEFNANDELTPQVCVAYNYDKIGTTSLAHKEGGTYNGIPSAIPFILINDSINEFISTLNTANQTNYIFTVFTIPKLAAHIEWGQNEHYREILNGSENTFTQSQVTILSTEAPTELSGKYKPHNKKLLTYPYAYLGFTAPNGSPKIYRYENFINPDKIEFKGVSEINPNPTVVIRPEGYHGTYHDALSAVTINGYPMISYTNDVFNTWLAQNSQIVNLSVDRTNFQYDMQMARNNIATSRENANATANLINNAVSAATSTMSGNLAGMITGTVGGINAVENHNLNLQDLALSNLANAGNKMYDIRAINAQVEKQALLPDTGVLSSSNATLLGYGYFWQTTFARFSIKSEYAKRIDDFFDMYGYQTNELKLPNTRSRYWYNYVKTVGANIVGDIPESDLNVIKAIFDNGVTIWHHPEEIYKYTGHQGENWEVKVSGEAVYE